MMKRLFLYILICSYLFALLDWQTVHITRWTNREWLEWMHAHEKHYVMIVRPIEYILCTPAMAFKPIFFEGFKRAKASQEEQDAITHHPPMDIRGFYQLHSRSTSWTFTPWWAWFLYWTIPSYLWWKFISRHFIIRIRKEQYER